MKVLCRTHGPYHLVRRCLFPSVTEIVVCHPPWHRPLAVAWSGVRWDAATQVHCYSKFQDEAEWYVGQHLSSMLLVYCLPGNSGWTREIRE